MLLMFKRCCCVMKVDVVGEMKRKRKLVRKA
jgi:hypothetical protein